jgi:hypothetical protein
MSIPEGMLTLRAIRLGVSGPNEIFLCPDAGSFFSGNLSISGVLTANAVSAAGGISDLCFAIGQPSDYNDVAIGARPLDLSQSVFTNNIGLNLTNATLGCDAFQLIDQYFYTYWLSPPPAPTDSVCTPTTTKLTVSWTNIPTIEAAFRDIELPHIIEMRIDFIPSDDNGAGHNVWSGATLKTIQTTSKFTDTLEMYTIGSGNNLNGTTWEHYDDFLPETNYDFRIYGVNDHSGTLNYLQINECKTSTVGIPIIVSGLAESSTGVNNINMAWTKPIDHDDVTAGDNTVPAIEKYQVKYTANSSIRYGGIYTGSHVGTVYTNTATDPINSDSNINITGLYPGTVYDITVAAKNTLNSLDGGNSDGYGPTDTDSATSSNPTIPSLLSIGDGNSLDVSGGALATYTTQDGYSLDGTTQKDYIINHNNVNGTNFSRVIRTSITPEIRHNNIAASTANSITTLIGYGGLSSEYTNVGNTASIVFNGFGSNQTPVNNITGKTQLFATDEEDHYSGSSTGFWQHLQMYSQAYDPTTQYSATVSEYSIGLRYESIQGVGPINTSPVNFHMDNLNTVPILTHVGVKNEEIGSGTGWSYISGIPGYTNASEFLIQFNIQNVANKFLRLDKKHIDMRMQTSGGTALSATNTIEQGDIDGTHRYFAGTGNHTTSTSLHNGSGLVLTVDPPDIQLNEFTVVLNSNANDKYDEDFVVRVIPSNLFGTGSTVTANYYTNAASPSPLKLRIDTKSIENLANINSTGNKGSQVRSGSGQYPAIGTAQDQVGEAYDHTFSLLHANYDEELQMVAGLYSSPDAVGTGYLDYSSDYFFSGAPTIPDYSSITNGDSNYRYTTFKLSGLEAGIPSGQTRERLRITINNMTGLTIDTQTPDQANHRVQLRIVDIGDGTNVDDHTTTVSWLDASDVVSGTGILTGTAGTKCLSQSTSTNSQRDAFIRPGTTSSAVIYIRIGIPNNLDAKFSCITVVAQAGAFA